jgi:hypothetical protein
MKPIRKTRHALMFMGAGALGAYFLDPEAGPARRDRVMDQFRSLTGDMGSSGEGNPSDRGSSSSSGSSGEVSSSSGQGSADAFAGSGGDSSSASQETQESSGPIDLATGKPVSESTLGA